MAIPAEPLPLTPGQRRTAKARATFSETFSSAEERSNFYRRIAEESSKSRVVLSGADARALSEAYGLLRRIAERGKFPSELSACTENEATVDATGASTEAV